MEDALYSESAAAKIWGVALRSLSKATPPDQYPEYTSPTGQEYIYSSAEFWTSGFFPGCLALLHQRQRNWSPRNLQQPHPLKLQHAIKWWTEPLHSQAQRKDTHDLGFMIQPWAQLGWQLDGDRKCLESCIAAARSLASRFDPAVGCIRSWDTCVTRRYSFLDPSKNFLVIIDNMMNLDLLYYVSALTGDRRMAEIATSHAHTSMKAHIREDGSTCHVVDFEPVTGEIQARFTNQGYSDDSCWTRGQAWGIAGFAQAFGWTKDERFLNASRKLADYFLKRISDDNTVVWDFDAPKPGPSDTSAALIAVYGLLLIHEAEMSFSHMDHIAGSYLEAAIKILAAVVSSSLSPAAKFVKTSSGNENVDLGNGHETIIMHATINNYEFAPRRWADHGLVYADYFFLLIGNKLLDMGLVRTNHAGTDAACSRCNGMG